MVLLPFLLLSSFCSVRGRTLSDRFTYHSHQPLTESFLLGYYFHLIFVALKYYYKYFLYICVKKIFTYMYRTYFINISVLDSKMMEIIIYQNYCNYIFILLREKERGVTDDVTALVCSRDVQCFFFL